MFFNFGITIGCVKNPVISNVTTSQMVNSNKKNPFAFDMDNPGLETPPRTIPYQFSTPLSCNSVFSPSNSFRHPQEHTEPTRTNLRRKRRTRNVHFMMAGGKISSSEDSPINLVDLDKSMDLSTSS